MNRHTFIIGAGWHQCTSCGDYTHCSWRVCMAPGCNVEIRRCAKCGGEPRAIERAAEHVEAAHGGRG